jgi:hypothetical protein
MQMSDVVEPLILDLQEFVAKEERSYTEVMEAWRTSCPKLPVWEEANERGLIAIGIEKGIEVVRITPVGVAHLKRQRASQKRNVPERN